MNSVRTTLSVGIALAASACTHGHYGPYYGPSQGYVYPSPGYGYYDMRPFYQPARYGYAAPYGGYGGGPSITLTLPTGSLP